MTVQSIRRRRRLLAWIPAGVLVIAVIGVGVASALLLGNGLGEPAPKPTVGQVTDLNWSSFTPEGLEFIRSSRQVRIDMSRPPVQAGPLGLEADGTLVLEPINTGDTELDYSLIINGGGEGAGGDKFIVTQIEIVTEDGLVTHVRAPLRDVLNFRQTLDKLLDKAELFGWDVSGVDDIYTLVEKATRAGEPYQFGFGPAGRAGMDVSATASCDTSGFCLVEYDAAPSVR